MSMPNIKNITRKICRWPYLLVGGVSVLSAAFLLGVERVDFVPTQDMPVPTADRLQRPHMLFIPFSKPLKISLGLLSCKLNVGDLNPFVQDAYYPMSMYFFFVDARRNYKLILSVPEGDEYRKFEAEFCPAKTSCIILSPNGVTVQQE